MIQEIEALKKIAAGKINKARLPVIQAELAKASELCERLESKSDNEDTNEEFEDFKSQLEDALSELENACDDLEAAEDKEERDDAVDQIACALDDAISGLEAIMPVAVVSSADHSAVKNEVKAKVEELLRLPPEERGTALQTWIQSFATEGLKQRRIKAFEEHLESLRRDKPAPES